MASSVFKAIAIATFFVGSLFTQVRAQQSCRGDCNLDGRVSISELVLGVQILQLRASPDECRAMSSRPAALPIATVPPISVGDLVVAVLDSLNGCRGALCGDGLVDLGETCDVGTEDGPCDGLCLDDCTCPEPFCGNGVSEVGEECDGDDVDPKIARDLTMVPQPSTVGCVDCGVVVDNLSNQQCLFFGCSTGTCITAGPVGTDSGTCVDVVRCVENLDECPHLELLNFCTGNFFQNCTGPCHEAVLQQLDWLVDILKSGSGGCRYDVFIDPF